jgi:ATP-dependent DNA helicase RecG
MESIVIMSAMSPVTDEELRRVSRELESERVERKAAFSDRDKVAEAVCAFANDLPGSGLTGYVLIGVDDAGNPSNAQITDRLLLALADMRDDGNILPRPSMTVNRRVIDGVDVALVEVKPSNAPPVRYKGRTWIRVGPRRAIATAEEEARLSERRRAADLPFDARPLSSATFDDLDLDLFKRTYLPTALAPEVIAANERSVEHQLAALRFATADGSPTVAGMVAVGREPASFIAGAFVQFLRIDGVDLTDQIVAEYRIGRPLPEMLSELDELLKVNVRTAVDLTSGTVERRRPDYPLVALQQLTRNAVMHRNYETSTSPVRITWLADRIEIQNPGGPFGQVTVENFGEPGLTDYRNPTIAEAMRQLGYVQRFGVGIATARKALADNENPELSFQVEPTYVAAILRSA